MSMSDPHDGGPCDCDWSKGHYDAAWLQHRALRVPDQSRYGTATTDPLGRDEPGWHKGTHGLPVKTRAPKIRKEDL